MIPPKRLNNLTLAASLRHASRESPDLFLSDHDPRLQREWMDQLQTLLKQAAEGLERGEMRGRELRLFYVRAKLAKANAEAWERLKLRNRERSTVSEPLSRITRRAATLDAREKIVNRIAKEWGLE